MKRRSFFATVAALFAAPKVLESKPKEVSFFDPVKLQERLNDIRKYPLTLKDVFGVGYIVIKDGYISMFTPDNHLCIGNEICLDVSHDPFFCYKHNRDSGEYFIRPMTPIKTICGRPVIMLRGKYVQFRQGKNNTQSVRYCIVGSAFMEGGVRNA